MATIKEMADNEYPTYYDVWMHNAYIEGANAVLDEIEKFAVSTWGNSLTFISLKKKIKELKGE